MGAWTWVVVLSAAVYLAVLGMGTTSQVFPLTVSLLPSVHIEPAAAAGAGGGGGGGGSSRTVTLSASSDTPGWVVGSVDTRGLQALARHALADLTLSLAQQSAPFHTYNITLGPGSALQGGLLIDPDAGPCTALPPGPYAVSFALTPANPAAYSRSPVNARCPAPPSSLSAPLPVLASPLPRALLPSVLWVSGVSPTLFHWARSAAWTHHLATALVLAVYLVVAATVSAPGVAARLAQNGSAPAAAASLWAAFRTAVLAREVVAALGLVSLVLVVLVDLREVINVPVLSLFLFVMWLATAVWPLVLAALLVRVLGTGGSGRIAPAVELGGPEHPEPARVPEPEPEPAPAARLDPASPARPAALVLPPYNLGPDGEDDPADDAPYYCPLCMMYFASMFQTSCCSQHTCARCANEYAGLSLDAPADPASLTRAHALVCAFCTRPDDWAYVPVASADVARKYEDTPFKKISREDAARAAYTPMRIGADNDELRRKLVGYDELAALATPVQPAIAPAPATPPSPPRAPDLEPSLSPPLLNSSPMSSSPSGPADADP